MSRQEKAKLIASLHEVWCTGEFALIPLVYFTGFVASMSKGWERSEYRGHSGIRDATVRMRQVFSEWNEAIHDLIIDGDKVVTRYVSTGIHTGPFISQSPTKRSIMTDEMSISRV